jgi:D-glycero-alpha-D-manno-heptose-7-phosphate kinase
MLCHSGISHHSGTDNWNTLKNRIEHPGHVKHYWDQIAALSLDISNAFIKEDLTAIADFVSKEWSYRQKLHPAIFNLEMRDIIKEINENIFGMKACGAGNGGVMILFVEKSDKMEVVDRLATTTSEILSWQIDNDGLSQV